MQEASSTTFTVLFRVQFKVEYGTNVFLSGKGDTLGNWDVSKAIPLKYEGFNDFWSAHVSFPLTKESSEIEYKYFCSAYGQDASFEPECNRVLRLAPITKPSLIETIDVLHWTDLVQSSYETAPFAEVINRPKEILIDEKISTDGVSDEEVNLYINARCPYVKKNQTLIVVGSSEEFGAWAPEKGIPMTNEHFPEWSAHVRVPRSAFPLEYKFVLGQEDGAYLWENVANRHIDTPISITKNLTLVRNEWLVSPNPELFKAMGIYVPLFSLRTKRSQGIGSYTDLKDLVDCCNAMGSSLIQLLPINDTTNKGTWADSYPYRQVSCFALHPVYIDLYSVLSSTPKDLLAKIDAKREELEKLPEVDYPTIFAFKMEILKEMFAREKKAFATSKELESFLEKNGSWLKPYALFCQLRDEYGTMEFRTWPKYSKVSPSEIEYLCSAKKEELLFHYWMQYIADRQFKESVKYATDHAVVFKGDLPIGVNIDSVECWAFPNLFRLHMCAGAPPDEFSSDGQNWGFPTYDWDAMEADGFQWWRSRLQRMAELYQCLRVDHILGFYRIWEIPRDTCIRGLLGHFFPACPLSRGELNGWGLWDIDRYTRPYIRWHLLEQKFGDRAKEVADRFMRPLNRCYPDDFFEMKPEYDCEKKVDAALEADTSLEAGWKEHLRVNLFQLIGNVLLIEDPERPDHYHVRTEVRKEHVEKTPWGVTVFPSSSLMELPDDQKYKMMELYEDFTYKRNTGLWCAKADAKIHMLRTATKMLVAGEDLGQITEGIVKHLSNSGLLSLRVQRMSKDPKDDFDDYNAFPYLGVACPSTHDTSSLRGWWEEDRESVGKFWHHILMRGDSCPQHLDVDTQTSIISQNIWSNSMLAIFLLQDLTSCTEALRRQTPDEERINIPADPNHKWRYRYPFTLEELKADKEFNAKIHDLAINSHRI